MPIYGLRIILSREQWLNYMIWLLSNDVRSRQDLNRNPVSDDHLVDNVSQLIRSDHENRGLNRGRSIESCNRAVANEFLFRLCVPDEGKNSLPTKIPEKSLKSYARPINLGKLIKQKFDNKEKFWSFELVPTNDTNVYKSTKISKMILFNGVVYLTNLVLKSFFKETQEFSPLFYSLTWHIDLTNGVKQFPALKCAEYLPPNTLMHCAAKGLKTADLEIILNRALNLGINNIFALQGDGDADNGDFLYASDLVKYIRKHFDQKFSICVAGYPEMHPKSLSKEIELHQLKAKVDAGADFIITQMVFESRLFIDFLRDCRDIGIAVPIIPGIYPFTSVKALNKMSKICQVKIPQWLEESLKPISGDVETVNKLGIDLSVKIIREISERQSSCFFHLFCLNR
ncbi:methylenetetrahydrofolate reductase [Copidosoma floridanum]|uniref:methylenetetrahydrofolate reductase n=1 Tax=Copidosoma floridanum TaxID=29053 RepID=UPI0006C9707C|nr:methylenetetrahydrofolate reductase [Copidosoma floridanum]